MKPRVTEAANVIRNKHQVINLTLEQRFFLGQCLQQAYDAMRSHQDADGQPLYPVSALFINPDLNDVHIAHPHPTQLFVIGDDSFLAANAALMTGVHAILLPVELLDILSERQLTALLIHEMRHSHHQQTMMRLGLDDKIAQIAQMEERLENLPEIAQKLASPFMLHMVQQCRQILSDTEKDSDLAAIRAGYGDDLMSAVITITAYTLQAQIGLNVDFDLMEPNEVIAFIDEFNDFCLGELKNNRAYSILVGFPDHHDYTRLEARGNFVDQELARGSTPPTEKKSFAEHEETRGDSPSLAPGGLDI